MCDIDEFRWPDIDPIFFKDDEIIMDEPLYNPFYDPAPGEIIDNDWDED